jgi:voltage-gated potassium channel
MHFRRRWVKLMAGTAGCLVAYFAAPVGGPVLSGSVAVAVALTVVGTIALGWSIYGQVRRYMLSGTTLTVDGLILTLVLVIVFFALALYLLEATDPGQIAGLHTRVDALYFTMATATTVGYGDVHAVGQLARVVVIVQLAFNVVFVAAVVALLSSRMRTVVTRHASTPSRDDARTAAERRRRRPPDGESPIADEAIGS